METSTGSRKPALRADGAGFEKIIATFPVEVCAAGQTIIAAGSKTGRLLILKSGAVAILKNGVEIARVDEPGAVLGELSALLDQPHAADVRTLSDSEFYVADAELLQRDPAAVLHVARVLARRLLAANEGLLALKAQLQSGQSAGTVAKMLEKIEQVLKVGGGSIGPGY